MKTNLETQLTLFREGFWLIDFYFLALLSKTIISKELVCPAPAAPTPISTQRDDPMKTVQHSPGFPAWGAFPQRRLLLTGANLHPTQKLPCN